MSNVNFDHIRSDPDSSYGKMAKASSVDLTVLSAVLFFLVLFIIGGLGLNPSDLTTKLADNLAGKPLIIDREAPEFQTTQTFLDLGPAQLPTKKIYQATDAQTVTYTVKQGSLPKGLRLTPTGHLMGEALEVGHFNITIAAKDSSGNEALLPQLLQISQPCPAWFKNNQRCVSTFKNTQNALLGILPLLSNLSSQIIDAEVEGNLSLFNLDKIAGTIYLVLYNPKPYQEKLHTTLASLSDLEAPKTLFAETKRLNLLSPSAGVPTLEH